MAAVMKFAKLSFKSFGLFLYILFTLFFRAFNRLTNTEPGRQSDFESHFNFTQIMEANNNSSCFDNIGSFLLLTFLFGNFFFLQPTNSRNPPRSQWLAFEGFAQLYYNQYIFKTMANIEWDITQCVRVWRGCQSPRSVSNIVARLSPVCLWRTSAADKRWACAPLCISFGSLLSIKARRGGPCIMWQSLSLSLAFDAWGRLN